MQYNISPETMRGQLMQYDLSVTSKSVDMFLDGELDVVRDEQQRNQIREDIKNVVNGFAPNSSSSKLTDYFLNFETIREPLEKHNLTIAPTGCVFDKTTRGFLPTLMETMYNDRSLWKKRMLEAKKAYEQTPTRELSNEIARCHNMQLAKKIQLNSAYGALSNQFFRWFDNRLAESITKSGQLSIRWMEKKMNAQLNKILKTDNEDFVIAIDTDSMYIKLGKFVEKTYPDRNKPITVTYLDKVCAEYFEPFIDKSYQELADYVSAYEQKMKMKREAIADKGLWTGKKHYILNVYDLEGVRFAEPKLKIQGIESVRSSTPATCREHLKAAFSVIMNENESSLQKFIKDYRRVFKTLPFEDIAFPRSVRGMLKSDQSNKKSGKLVQKSYNTGTMNFLPGTPIHVKGSLMYNHLIRLMNLETKYMPIGEGEKIKFCYLLDSSPLPTNVIAAPGKLPKELGLNKFLDYDTQFDKSFMEPLRTIMEAIGWKEENEQQSLDQFF
jgi:DNA polymerase elongation subunit (family B)